MRPYQPPYEQILYGGMNDAADEELVNKYEGSLVQNGNIRNVGSFSGRAGSTLVGNDTGNLRIQGWGLKRNGTKFMTRIVNGASNATIEKLSGTTWGAIGGATLTKDTDIITMEFGNGKVYYFDGDGTHDVPSYDGTTWTTVAAIPKGVGGVEWKNFAWVWGVTNYEKRLYFSNIGNPEVYTASDYIDFPEDIISVVAYFNRLVVGMRHSVAIIEGSGGTDFVVSGKTIYQPLGFDFGIASHESVQIVNNELWGMDQEGRIRRIFRSSNDVLFGGVVSTKIENLIASLNKNALNKVTAAFIDGYYIFYAPAGSATENNVGAYYDTRATLPDNVSAWQKHTGWTPSHFCVYESSNKPELYWGENTADSKTYKWTGNSDNGVAIEMIWRSGKYNDKMPNRPKLYRWGKQQYEPIGNYNGLIKANIDGRGWNTVKTVNMQGSGDLLGSSFTLGTSVLGSQERLAETFYFKDGGDDIVGKTLQRELYASYSAAIPIWYKQTYMFKALRMR